MIILLEIAVLALLALCVWRGLFIWHRHRDVLATFEASDLKAAVFVAHADNKADRINAWLARNFLLVTFTIVLSVMDFCLRLNWALQNNWIVTGDLWAYAWLTFHLGLSLFFLKILNIAHAALVSIEDWEGIEDGR